MVPCFLRLDMSAVLCEILYAEAVWERRAASSRGLLAFRFFWSWLHHHVALFYFFCSYFFSKCFSFVLVLGTPVM